MTECGDDPSHVRKRELGASDRQILMEATLANVNWVGPRFTARDVVSTPEFSRYVAFDATRGDFGMVALDRDNEWVGVVWVLFLPAECPGFGFIDAETGELSVSVKQGMRRRGLGRELMRDAMEMARARGHSRLGLSVEGGNPAVHLYRALGFVDVDPSHLPGTMLLAW